MVLQCFQEAVIPQLADGSVVPARNYRRDAPVAPPDQFFGCPVRCGKIVDGDRGIILLIQVPEAVGVTAAHKGNPDHRQFRGRIVKPSAQEQQPLQLLFALENGPGLDLVGIRADEMQHHRVAIPLDLIGHRFQHRGKKEVPRAAHHNTDGVGAAFYQVPGAVVRNITGALNLVQYALSDLLAHIRVLVQHTGYGTHAHAAVFRNVFDRHGSSDPSIRKRSPVSTGLRVLPQLVETIPGTFPALTLRILAVNKFDVNEKKAPKKNFGALSIFQLCFLCKLLICFSAGRYKPGSPPGSHGCIPRPVA